MIWKEHLLCSSLRISKPRTNFKPCVTAANIHLLKVVKSRGPFITLHGRVWYRHRNTVKAWDTRVTQTETRVKRGIISMRRGRRYSNFENISKGMTTTKASKWGADGERIQFGDEDTIESEARNRGQTEDTDRSKDQRKSQVKERLLE